MMSSGKIWLQYSQIFIFSSVLLSVLKVGALRLGVGVECVVMELTVLHVLTPAVLEDFPIVKGESEICSLSVTNVGGISALIAESESGIATVLVEAATEVTVLKAEVVVRVDDGAVAVNIPRAQFETGATIPILDIAGTPILRTEDVSAADGAHTPMPIKEVAVGVTMERVVGTLIVTTPAVVGTVVTVTLAIAPPLEMTEITALVVAVTAASEEIPLA
jgi:hypothetical protein